MLFPSTTPLTSTNSEESAELENGREMGPFLEHEEVGVGIPDKRDVSNPTLSAFFSHFFQLILERFPCTSGVLCDSSSAIGSCAQVRSTSASASSRCLRNQGA
jgi:hypothetical protein